MAPSIVLPKKTLVGLAGQNAWHIWTGVALPRASGKYLPSQLRTQNAGPPPEATGAWRRRLVLAERIGEKVRLRRGLALLLFLETAEKQVEQAFGGRRARRQRNGAGEERGGNEHHAAPHALKRQLCTQRLLHPTPQTLPRQAVPRPDSH